MRAVIQRVIEASVRVGQETVGAIGPGYVVLLGVGESDTDKDLEFLAGKVLSLRLMTEGESHFSKDVTETRGELLVVSQFTLYADTRKGRRPSFSAAAKPEAAEAMYLRFVSRLRDSGLRIATGQFRAHMQVSLVNDGPVTIVLDSQL